MIESAPYWWVECDATGCDNRCPGPEYEHTAWRELSGAIESAEESGWRRDPAGRWFCDEHPRCEDCSEPVDDPALAWVEGVAYHRACSDEALPPPIPEWGCVTRSPSVTSC